MPTTLPPLKPKAKDDALYIGDNGSITCGQCAGASIRYTLRDISGQRAHRVTAADVAYARDEMDGHVLKCEGCGRVAA